LSVCQTKMMIDQDPGKSKSHENIIKKMPRPPSNQRTAYGTYLYFTELGVLETLMITVIF
jgi:hypothetical protein